MSKVINMRFGKVIGLILMSVCLLISGSCGIQKVTKDYLKETKESKDALWPPLVTNLQAEFRDGQVFVLWDEVNPTGADLKVYMHDTPITAANINAATLLTDRLGSGSGNDWFDDPDECPWTTGPVHGWVLEDARTPLDPTSGLFVHTITPSDPANAYFAVLGADENVEALNPGQNSLVNPIAVSTGDMQAVWQLGGSEAGNRPPAAGKALVILLSSHTGRPMPGLHYLAFGDATMGWREGLPIKFKISVASNYVLVEPYDRVWINRRIGASETYETYNTLYKNIESWWYGTNDKIYDPVLRLTGTPTNYTENILMWMLDWVEQAYQTDSHKVYAFGASMGTGVQRLVMQNPDRFASCDVLVPFVDFAYEYGAESNAKRFDASCGDVDLICSDGMALRDRLDLVDFAQDYTGDIPPITIRVGRQDGSVFWRRKPPYMAAMQQNRHSLLAGWDNGTHSSAMRYAITAFPNRADYNWYIQRFATNRSYPAFSNFSMNEDPGNGEKTDGDIVGFINRGLEFNVASIVDTASRYEIKLTCAHPSVVFPVTVDVTPRRRQSFNPSVGTQITASNLNLSSVVIDTKTLVVDSEGRITYEDFEITSSPGNTLVLQ